VFKNIINGFRRRDVEHYLIIGGDADEHPIYRYCVEFMDGFVSKDDENIHALNDYITYGDFGDGTVNLRLLVRLEKACREYQEVSFMAR
jgi:hypothetical protein